MFIKIHSASVLGISSVPISVEIDLCSAWPGFQIIGLPDTSIQEAKERIRTAWKNTGLDFPNNKRIVINLAPADIKKEGTAFDLPMAVGMYLLTQEQSIDVSKFLFVGELALDGSLRHTNGILPLVQFAQKTGYKGIFFPQVNAPEAGMVQGIQLFAAHNLREVLHHVSGATAITPSPSHTQNFFLHQKESSDLDMQYIKGQEFVKRALEVAASGGHNILLSGPPGSGKTLLARTFPSILPSMTAEETLEVTTIYSVAGMLKEQSMISVRPFRAPHHSASSVAIVGGGKYPRPGELSLSHRGVLFLDEFPEFSRSVIESLRQPLEDGTVTISRAQGNITFPARCLLLASQNPCPCGFFGDTTKTCTCTTAQIAKYQKKISGPILDRIDIHIEVPKVDPEKLRENILGEPSKDIRLRVERTRAIQNNRFITTKRTTNSEMNNHDIRKYCDLEEASQNLLSSAAQELQLSARSYHRILKLARTLADMEQKDHIETIHVAEALQYRQKEG